MNVHCANVQSEAAHLLQEGVSDIITVYMCILNIASYFSHRRNVRFMTDRLFNRSILLGAGMNVVISIQVGVSVFLNKGNTASSPRIGLHFIKISVWL